MGGKGGRLGGKVWGVKGGGNFVHTIHTHTHTHRQTTTGPQRPARGGNLKWLPKPCRLQDPHVGKMAT